MRPSGYATATAALQISRDTRHEAIKALKDVIRPQARVCLLGTDSYGACGQIAALHDSTVDVEVDVLPSPDVSKLLKAAA